MRGFRMCWLSVSVIVLFLSFTFNDVSAEALQHHHHKRKLPSAVVVGTVYCDTCFHQDFSKSSHFISGATVVVECGDAWKPSFQEEVKTDEKGEFRVNLPFSVSKHVKDIRGCSVKLVSSNEPYCSVASTATSSSIRLKSKKPGTHIFSAGFFTFKPLKQPDLCNQKPSIKNSLESQFPPSLPDPPMPFLPLVDQGILPPLPELPPLVPPLPRLPPIPLPPLPKKQGLNSNSNELSNQKILGLSFPPNPFKPPSLLPPNPFQSPPSLLPPNPFQPPPSLIPPLFLTPPPSLFPPLLPSPSPPPLLFPPLPFTPLPGLFPSPPPPPPPAFPIPLLPIPPFPPFPFQPTPGFPGVPPAFSSPPSKKTSP